MKTDFFSKTNMSSSSRSTNTLRHVANSEDSKQITWDDYTPEAKAMLMRGMPPEVRLRLKNGAKVSKKELDGYMAKYYKLNLNYALWLEPLDDPPARRLMRIILKDGFDNAKLTQQESKGRAVANWTDEDFATQGISAPKGHRWVLTLYDTNKTAEPQWPQPRQPAAPPPPPT